MKYRWQHVSTQLAIKHVWNESQGDIFMTAKHRFQSSPTVSQKANTGFWTISSQSFRHFIMSVDSHFIWHIANILTMLDGKTKICDKIKVSWLPPVFNHSENANYPLTIHFRWLSMFYYEHFSYVFTDYLEPLMMYTFLQSIGIWIFV